MPETTMIQHISAWIIPVLLAITLHEAAHAYVANALGDSTAKAQGRLSLNPLKHIDLVGTILLPLLVAVATQFKFVFGYAKPVPVSWHRLRNPRRDMAFVTLAGPLSNLLMAVMWAGVLKLAMGMSPESSNNALFLLLTGQAGIIVNLTLAFLNLIPIPPLDGSRVVSSLLPPSYAQSYNRLEPYGFLILLILLISGVLSAVLFPLIRSSYYLLLTLFNL